MQCLLLINFFFLTFNFCRSAREDDPLLLDSDDDDPKTTQRYIENVLDTSADSYCRLIVVSRKRLKTTKQAAAPSPAKQKATEPAPIASPARRTTAPPDRGFFQSPMPPHKAPVKSPSKGGQGSTSNGGRDTTPVKRDSPPVLPVLTANPIGSPVKIVREVCILTIIARRMLLLIICYMVA